jgi:triosephosphate isomerase
MSARIDVASLRAPVLAGNWKMNKGPRATREFFLAFSDEYAARSDRTVIFFPPALSLTTAVEALVGRTDLQLGVQNVFWEKSGAYTGEISAPMAVEAGAHFALTGHSERRHVFGESDAEVGRKAAAALEAGLTPVICVGETLDERRAGRLEEVLERQCAAAFAPLDTGAGPILLAYEPVWAIGTGVNATPEDATAAHRFLRERFAKWRGRDEAQTLRILYGGSVKPDNAAELLAAPEVDGLLVGGASLEPAGFARIAGVELHQ